MAKRLWPISLAFMLGTGSATVLAVYPRPATAHILCDGEFQITKYGPIATPYCGHQVIARVAVTVQGGTIIVTVPGFPGFGAVYYKRHRQPQETDDYNLPSEAQ